MMWFCICVSAFVCLCVWYPIIPQKSLCFSSVAFSAVAKTGPSAASGGAGVGLPGHVSGWWLCQSIRLMHEETHFACQKTGNESTATATAPMWKSLWNKTLLFLQQRIVVDSINNKLWCYIRINVGNPQVQFDQRFLHCHKMFPLALNRNSLQADVMMINKCSYKHALKELNWLAY